MRCHTKMIKVSYHFNQRCGKVIVTKYIPVLANEGIKHEVGGRGMRGGLLGTDPRDAQDRNTLQLIVNLGNSSDPIPDDTVLKSIDFSIIISLSF